MKARSEKWVKPTVLRLWLELARERKYTHCRLVMHGGDKKTYDGIRADRIGFDLRCVRQSRSTPARPRAATF